MLYLTNCTYHMWHHWLCDVWHIECHADNMAGGHTGNGATCGSYNFGKYTIFHRPDKAVLFIMVKASLRLSIFSVIQNLRELCSFTYL